MQIKNLDYHSVRNVMFDVWLISLLCPGHGVEYGMYEIVWLIFFHLIYPLCPLSLCIMCFFITELHISTVTVHSSNKMHCVEP